MSAASSVNGQALEDSVAGVGENVAGLAHDLVSLAELQAQLLMLDLQEGGAQAFRPTIVMAGGACVALGSVPVILMGLGGLLADGTSLSQPVAWLIVSLSALLLSGVCLWYGSVQLKQASQILLRSQEELKETICWIKKVIEQTSTR